MCDHMLVSDAQDCPLERVGVVVNVCGDTRAKSHGMPSYEMIILLGRGTNHITDRVRRKGQQQPSQNVCNRPLVSFLAVVPCIWDSTISRGVQNSGIQASDSLDGYISRGIESDQPCSAYRTRDFTFGARDAHTDDDYFRPSSSPAKNYEIYPPALPGWPGTRSPPRNAITGAEHRVYRVL
jgi:hypothetical protein